MCLSKLLILLALAIASPCFAPDPINLADLKVFVDEYDRYFDAKEHGTSERERLLTLLWRHARWLDTRKPGEFSIEWRDKMMLFLNRSTEIYIEDKELDVFHSMLRVVFLFPFSDDEEQFLYLMTLYHFDDAKAMELVFDRLKELVNEAPLRKRMEKLLVDYAFEVAGSAIKVEPLITLPHEISRLNNVLDDSSLCRGHLVEARNGIE